MQEILLTGLLLAIIAYWWDTTPYQRNSHTELPTHLPVCRCSTAGCDRIQAARLAAPAPSRWSSDMSFIQLRIQPG